MTKTPKTAVVPMEPTHQMLETVSEKIRDAQRQGWHGLSPIEIWRTMLAAAPEALANRDPQAGEAWRPIETAPKDGTEVLLLVHGMAIQARYHAGGWSEETPVSPAEYDGAVWVAFDDLTQFEIEEGALEGGRDDHGPVTHWVPLLASPQDDRMGTPAERNVPRRYQNDAAAKVIYDGWSDLPGWVPWVEHGNSDRQEEARRLANTKEGEG